jgi:DNA-binding XRE family transcriptional regulator
VAMQKTNEHTLAPIGRQLETERLKRAWTKEDLAVALGLSRDGAYKLKTGRTRASIQTALAVAYVLGQPVQDVLTTINQHWRRNEANRADEEEHGSVVRSREAGVR